MDPIDPVTSRRGHMRWTVLLTLNHARPIGADETLIISTIQGVFPDVTPVELRRELSYLEARGLVKIERSHTGVWRSELTRHGVDIAEYTVECEPGITRPIKYWS